MAKQMHVAANFPQDFTEEEKAQARENIGAVNREYFGSDTIDVDSDGVITGKYRGGYGIEISGNTISKTHHRLIATNNVQYAYCKVFDFTWQYVYGRGQCVFTASHYGGSFVTFSVTLTRALGADYTVAWPYVVDASDDMAKSSAFVERLEIRSVGNRIVGYLKLRNFAQNQFWLDWEGSSNAGIVSFTPQLTNSPEGSIEWTRTVDKYDVWYSQADTDYTFQKKLVEGSHIHIDSDNVISADSNTMRKMTTTLPPVETAFNTLTVFTDGRVHGDSSGLGCLAPEPSQGDAGKVLVAYWTGSPGIGTARWETITIPTVVDYLAGTGITSNVNPDTGDVTFSWEYSVGRNLHLNQNNAIQTNLPGGLYDAPSTESNSFATLGTGANFAGAYRLMCRHNPNGTYELAIQYTASGTSSTITFIGTETVIGLDNSVTTKQAAYISEYSYYTPSTRFGGNASTIFNPASHKAIIYDGVAQIGPTSDCKIAIWQDDGSIKISFTAIEVGKVGSTV